VRLGIFQCVGAAGDPVANLELLNRAAASAAERGVDLLVLPEMFLTGYHIGDQTLALAEAEDGASAARAAEVASSHGVALMYGYPERSGDAVYNAALVFDAAGNRLANFRKCHLFGPEEERLFAAGDRLVVFELGGLRVAPLVCYDVEFPEAVRALALAGADVVAVPTALMEPYDPVPMSVVPARAYENLLFVAYANRCGAERGMRYVGLSTIAAPDGSVLARADANEGLITADLDPAAYEKYKRENAHLTARRPELYARPVD